MQVKKTSKIKKLEKKQQQIFMKISKIGISCRGSVVTLKQSCTRKNCKKCISGEKHPQLYLSLSKNSKTKLTFLGKKKVELAKEWTQNYILLKECMEELTDINIQLLRLY